MSAEEQKSPENFGELKQKLRTYLLSEYSPRDGRRYPIADDKLAGGDIIALFLTALENENVDDLEKLQKSIENWFYYINEKDRAEGARAKALSEELQEWIDSILAR